MDQQRQAQLESLGFTRSFTGQHLTGIRLWWKRTGSAMDIVRQTDGATKHQDLGEGHPSLPRDEPATNRQWAMDLAEDELTEWQS